MQRPRRNILILFLALPASAALAESLNEPLRIDVFTTSTIEITGIELLQQQLVDTAIEVRSIDGIARIEAALGHGLSANAEVAERTALSRLTTFGSGERELLAQSSQALVLAWQYDVRRYPAVVFDGRWVLYGVTNLEEAFAIFQERRAEGGR